MAYIIFFLLTLLAAVGAGGIFFRGSSVAATSAGVTLLAFMTASLLVLGVLLFFGSKKITTNANLKRSNYAVFGIFVILALVNIGYLLYERQNLVNSQPVTRVVDYLRDRFGSRATGSGSSNQRFYSSQQAPLADTSAVRV